jgi:hypothetical protein
MDETKGRNEMTEKDPVMIDEAKRDRMQTAQEMLEAEGYSDAKLEFNCGELDDKICEAVQDYPMDAVNIALCAMYPEQVRFPASETDFKAMVKGIIDRRAQRITEDK